jgi:hypothetical protein
VACGAVFKSTISPSKSATSSTAPDFFQEMVEKTGQTKQPTVEINGRILADVSGGGSGSLVASRTAS